MSPHREHIIKMFIHNSFLYRTGTITYEADYQNESGYSTIPSTKTGDIEFALIDNDNIVKKSDDVGFRRVKGMTTHIDTKEINRLQDSGIEIKPHNTIVTFAGDDWRALNVETFGQEFNRNYFPINLYEVTFERITPDNA